MANVPFDLALINQIGDDAFDLVEVHVLIAHPLHGAAYRSRGEGTVSKAMVWGTGGGGWMNGQRRTFPSRRA